ncbi:hypothetical protein PR048_002291 [Dryococelus australis]|uniref:Uncharacterized protein n=1 Tax=Dryococelus australis TaxID=614101 RepID=A0ABQ9IJR3_9NEOP|nr:hypothetical protein PR048_002291 [Dryococelus australis]
MKVSLVCHASTFWAPFLRSPEVTRTLSHVYIMVQGGQKLKPYLQELPTRLMDVQGTMTSSYQPQCNAVVGKLHATLTTVASQCVSITFAYNISKQESTGFSPFLFVYGHEPISSSEICLNQKVYKVDSMQQQRKWKALQRQAVKNIRNQGKAKQCYDPQCRALEYQLGQEVLIYTSTRKKGLTPKLTQRWNDTAVVIKQLLRNLYLKKRKKKKKKK